jgi:DNA-binding CsgD family transcriptional regulator
MTSREAEVRRLVAEGLTNGQIAKRLGISSRTVEAHLRTLFRKTGVADRHELVTEERLRSEAAQVLGAPATEEEVRRLEEKLAERERQVESYEAAVQRMIARQFPLFDERVEITLTVGSRPSEDVVVERHWTDPNPYLVYRVIRPITRRDLPAENLDSLALTCEVVGADVGVAVQLVADPEGRPRALILFQPGLEEPAEWVLRYRTPGLWDPLRANGEDTLRWAAGTLDSRFADGISDLQVRFVFPDRAAGVEVTETRGAGQVERAGDTEVLYRDQSRTGGLYEWRLRMPRDTSG